MEISKLNINNKLKVNGGFPSVLEPQILKKARGRKQNIIQEMELLVTLSSLIFVCSILPILSIVATYPP